MIMLIILDGWGISEKVQGNAILQAKTPRYDQLMSTYPHSELGASGEDVGLPDNQMGNSEVGHMNLGAGRIVYQDYTRINRAIRDGTFFTKDYFMKAVKNVKENDSTLHLMGLVSDGGVHSHIKHVYALLELAKRHNINPVVHAFLDGRDVLPTSAEKYLNQLKEKFNQKGIGTIGTVMGRYYAMDRDTRWRRTQKAYEALTGKTGLHYDSAKEAVKESYNRGEHDEFVRPTIINGTICNTDSVIFFNFRPDRARQLTRAFVDDDFTHFEREKVNVYFVCMTEYQEGIDAPVVFPPLSLKNVLGEVLSTHKLQQLRIAETEKYYHVTYFFNGAQDGPFSGEHRIIIPSPRVATYDLKPEMSAYKVTERVIKEIKSGKYDVIILNYANPDMVAHTGDLKAGIKAIEAIDNCLGKVIDACNVTTSDNVVIITGDHGNAEQMTDPETGNPFTAHTPNPVPFIITKKCKIQSGILADIAPTILHLLQIEPPDEMTGESLIKEP